MDDVIIDVSTWQKLGPYYVAPADQANKPDESWMGGPDYRIGSWPVWSIGRIERDAAFQYKGEVLTATAGMVLASPTSDLYQARGVHCLWLR